MGSKCGPSIANVFVYTYEIAWLKVNKPLFYSRYIDDIFIVIHSLSQFEDIKNMFGKLIFKGEHNSEICYLDLKISLNKFSLQ